MSQKFSWGARIGVAVAAIGMLVTAGIAYATVPTLSQTNITVGLGQSLSVTATNGVSLYMYSNSGPTVTSVSINGTQVTVTGQALGSATVSVCAVGTASDCTNLGVTVQSGSVSGISFSQNSLSLPLGNNQSVTVTGGNGTYTISNNSNASAVSTNLSGNTITVSGLAVGGATINVCDTSNTCGNLSVTITAASSSNTSGLSFSQNNISVPAGTSQSVSISGGNGTYSISMVSNPTILSAGMSGSGVIVLASTAGSATVKVCDTTDLCGTLNVTVTPSTANQSVVFSVPNPTVAVGQSLNIALSGAASSFFILSNANTNVAQGSMSNSVTLALTGVSAGTDSLTVCAVGGAGCNPLSVTVSGPTTATTAPATTATTGTTVTTPTPVVQPASVVANTALLAEIQTLQNAVTQALATMQSIQSQLSQLEAQVNAGSGISTNVSASSGASGSFTELLNIGSQDAQATALQERLTTDGFYSGPITGYYGALTGQAVSKYQTAHGIAATGYVGPSTRTALNAGN